MKIFIFLAVIVTVCVKRTFSEFQSWTLDVDDDFHCTVVATPELTSTSPISLYMTLHNDILNINNKISPHKQLQDLNFDDAGNAAVARSSNWRLKACRKACKTATKDTCSIYNCKRIKHAFKHTCKQNCKDQFE